MWVAESSWDGAELGTCRQRSWCGQRSWSRQIVVMMLQCNLRLGSRAQRRGEGGRTTQTLGLTVLPLETAFPLSSFFIFLETFEAIFPQFI